MLRSGLAYGSTGALVVRRRFFRRCSRYCCRRCWVRLGPSTGSVYVLGAEGFSGQNRGNTDWEASEPMQLQRGVRLGSRTTYAARSSSV